MSHDWFKLQNDFINDPKMKRYFTKSERLDWVNLLCLSSKSRERGVIIMPDDEIAYALDLEDEEWMAFRGKLIERRMIAIREPDEAILIVNWAERQYDKPSDAPAVTAERKRRSRAAQTQEIAPVSRPVTPCHATDKIRGDKRREDSSLTGGGGRACEASPPLPDASAGAVFPPEAPLPVMAADFIASKGAEAKRWERELRLELLGKPLTGQPSAYIMAILRGWERNGLPQPRDMPQRPPGGYVRDTPKTRYAASQAKHAERLREDLERLGMASLGISTPTGLSTTRGAN